MQPRDDFKPLNRQDVLSHYNAFEQRIAGHPVAAERRMLTGYLLHSMLAVSGRYEELFDDKAMAQEPEYLFHDTGQALRGRDAIIGHYRTQAATGATLTIPDAQRIAVASWGFATEQVDHSYLTTEAASQRGLKTDDADAAFVERIHLALVWRCNPRGGLESMRLYPAKSRSVTAIPKSQLLQTSDLSTVLQPMIARAQERLQKENSTSA